MSLTDHDKQSRLREKLQRYGPEGLRDSELLAIIIRTGVYKTSAVELSSKILRGWKEPGLDSASLEQLTKMHGLGRAKASEIIACFELGRRFLMGKNSSILLSGKDVWERMTEIRSSKREHFVVFCLDSRDQEIKKELVSIGTLNETLVHPREVFEQAIVNHAASVIFAHNHPSGDPEPSAADLEITKRLVNAGRILDIAVLNHVIVTKDSWKSIL